MERRELVLMCVLGCGGGASSDPDAAVADVAIDAPGDRDNDGVLDYLDVCPDIADPAQVDMDGDRIGWMCDPEESTTVMANGVSTSTTHSHDDTFVTRIQHGCSSTCKDALIAIGPGGFKKLGSESGAAADAWLKQGLRDEPFVSRHGVVYAAPAGFPESIGSFDLVSGAYTPRFMGKPNASPLLANLEVLAVRGATTSMGDTFGVFLDPKANGELASVGVSSASFTTQPADMAEMGVSSDATPVIGVPIWNGSSLSLARWVPGVATWALVQAGGTPLSGLSTITNVGAPYLATGYCVLRSGTAYLAILHSDGDVTGPMPSTDCNVTTSFGPGFQFYRGDQGIAYAYQGVVHALTGPIPDLVNIESVAGDVPLALVHRQATTDAWAVDSAGNPIQLATALTEVEASSSGTTAHVVGRRAGNAVVVRFRSGAAPVELPIPGNPSGGISVLTTHEGAALVTTTTAGWVLPSQASTLATIDLADADGAVRGAFTVLRGKRTQAGALHQVFAYNEAAGLTSIAAPQANLMFGAIGAASPWFYFYASSTPCSIARLGVVAGAPAIAGSVACSGNGSVVSDGYTSNGDLVASERNSGWSVYILGSTPTRMFTTSDFSGRVLTEQLTDHVYGWSGIDSMGAGFVCLASHPDRCWRIPSATGTWSGHWGTNGAPDTLRFSTVTPAGNGNVTLTHVRSIGIGTRPRPL